MVPLTGLALRWLDGRLAHAYGAALRTRRSLVHLVMATTAAAGLLDLFWVGTFTYSARTVTSVLLLVGLLWVASPSGMRGRQARTQVMLET